MDFITFYKAISNKIEKRRLRSKIIEHCQIQPPTFYSWLLREKIPPLAQEKIALILEKSQTELFPNECLTIKKNNYENS